jgi:hypothetical protein
MTRFLSLEEEKYDEKALLEVKNKYEDAGHPEPLKIKLTSKKVCNCAEYILPR